MLLDELTSRFHLLAHEGREHLFRLDHIFQFDLQQGAFLRVEGRFDFSAHQQFREAYMNEPAGDVQFVVDVRDTETMDSSALGM